MFGVSTGMEERKETTRIRTQDAYGRGPSLNIRRIREILTKVKARGLAIVHRCGLDQLLKELVSAEQEFCSAPEIGIVKGGERKVDFRVVEGLEFVHASMLPRLSPM